MLSGDPKNAICRIVKAGIFDPSLVYTFMDTITEYDNIIIANDQILVIEDISKSLEWSKKILYKFLAPASSVEILWNCERVNINESTPGICIDRLSEIFDLEKLSHGVKGCFKGSSEEEEIKCMEELYLYASEPLNLLLYSLVFMPKGYRELIINDVARSLGLRLSTSRSKIMQLFTELSKRYCKESVLGKYIVSSNGFKPIEEIYVLIPRGVKRYRLKAIMKLTNTLCSILSCNNVHLLISKKVKEKSPNIVKLCMKERSNEKTLCRDLEEEGKELRDYVSEAIGRCKHILIIIMGDYNKQALSKIINDYRGYSVNILIIPEVAYMPKRLCEKSSDLRGKIVNAYGMYLKQCLSSHMDNHDVFWNLLLTKSLITNLKNLT